MQTETGLERKFCRFDEDLAVIDGTHIEGYASYFGRKDRGGDVVERGAYVGALRRLAEEI
ncbi:MAG: hypothetical protein AAFN80_15310 [Pseudomonadota bacterium]